ncbi:uncharacterized protein ACA1_038270 [Acanthamoeba castellanii str. Neff]|uniref:Uncharacterized protein n=1 Tax=Acanthamoeba castellanii (strain ATCC 30010 / Neff) TaxID=1257118 RepID=L8GKW3_ACACF|nr:uncharacterized protein ACA1_038270 [Acanthamoeba castellanii str. Neff]ELR13642.1 hypothetical protein ACA1_038270 [Acanthamoeba castellanii str. Neff]
MASAKERFQQLAEQEAAAQKQREAEEKKREEERRRKAQGGQTKIGTTKGQIKAFATAFEAIADGDDVEISVKNGGWNTSNVTSDSRGKWVGGPAGMQAQRIEKEKPTAPPPPKSIADLP